MINETCLRVSYSDSFFFFLQEKVTLQTKSKIDYKQKKNPKKTWIDTTTKAAQQQFEEFACENQSFSLRNGKCKNPL